MTHRLLAPLLAPLVGLALLVAGCGGDSDNEASSPSSSESSPTASGSNAELCDTFDQLKSDVDTMANANSVSEFQSDYDAVQQDFADLKPAANAAYSDDVDAIGKALKNFGKALQSFDNEGVMQGLENLGTAAGDVSDSVDQLASDLPCPSNS